MRAGLLPTGLELMTPSPVSIETDPFGGHTARSWDRTAFSLEVGIRRSGGRSFRVRLFDLSPQGCKMEFVERPDVGECVWVKFDRLQGIEGRVRWVAGHTGGVQFQPAMHEAVFRGLIA
jgi:hypothetical protein